MKKWKVTFNRGETVVEATDLTVTASGALLFRVAGEVRCVFAPGHWVNAILQDGGHHGYR